MTFWKRVWIYARMKMKEKHLHKYGMDTQCVNCRTWASENDGYADTYEHTDGSTSLQCKRCYHDSRWDLNCPVPVFLFDGESKITDGKEM